MFCFKYCRKVSLEKLFWVIECCFGTSSTDLNQSQKTQGFCVADFATLSDEIMSHSKILLLIKEPCLRTFEGLIRSKILGIFYKLKRK